MKDEHIPELLPGYALDALEIEEQARVSRHLAECSICQKELEEYRTTVDYMSQAVPMASPAVGLRERVVAKVNRAAHRHPAVVQSELPRKNFWETFRAMFSSPARVALFGSLAILILILGINNLVLYQKINDLQSRVPGSNIRIIRLNGSANAPQTVGYMMIFSNENAGTLAVQEAPQLEPGHQYQVWLILAGKRTSGGVFSVNENGYGSLQIAADQPLEKFDSVGITIEPQGGSPSPTGSKILGGSL
jgi:anti-sigma-K factor RskA